MKKITGVLLCIILLTGFVAAAEGNTENIKIASGYRHVVVLNAYGRVSASGYTANGECNVYDWEGVKDICAGKHFTAALFEDGTVKVTGIAEETGAFDTDGLSDIVKIDAGANFLAALDAEGRVYTIGDCSGIDTSAWENITDIAAGDKHLAGLMEDGNCIGAGVGAASISEFSGIERIYAGASLTVVIDENGVLDSAGIGTYYDGDDPDEGGVWMPAEWSGADIKKIDIIKGSYGNGIVVALFNDKTVQSDGEKDEMWTVDCTKISEAVDISVTDSCEYPGVTVLKEDMSLETYGEFDTSIINAANWTKDIKNIKPNQKPVEGDIKGNIAIGYENAGLLLHNNKLKVFGNGIGQDIENIAAFMYIIKQDNYIYKDIYGEINSSLIIENEEDISFTWNKPNDINMWNGAEKIATYEWKKDNESRELVTALRWDGQIYSSDPDDEIANKVSNAVDVAGGYYFTAVLHDDKSVSVYETSTVTGRDLSPAKDWRGIEKIYAAYNQLIGIKEDGSCVAAGGKKDSNGEVKEICVDGWTNITDAVGGYGFTVGLMEDGSCKVAANDTNKAQKAKTEIEQWTGITELFGAYSTIVGYKNDGTFEVFEFYERPEIKKLEDTYYKDGEYIRFFADDNNVHTVEFALKNDRGDFVVMYDTDGKICAVKKATLEAGELTQLSLETSAENVDRYEILNWNSQNVIYYDDQMIIKAEEDGNTRSVSYISGCEKDMYIFHNNEEGSYSHAEVLTLSESAEEKAVQPEGGAETINEFVVCDKDDKIHIEEGLFIKPSVNESGEVTLQYISNKDVLCCVSAFDDEGNALQAENIELSKVNTLTEIETKNITGARDASLYIWEEETESPEEGLTFNISYEGEELVIKYLAMEDKKIAVSFYGSEKELVDVQIITLGATGKREEITISCDNAWTESKVLLWSGMKPLYIYKKTM